MGLGYQVEVNRRFGCHGGFSTEWEFETRACSDRVEALQALGHPLMVEFGADGASFCVLREDEHPGAKSLVRLLFDYMTCWPDEETELLAAIADE